jgi:hypothetical protein
MKIREYEPSLCGIGGAQFNFGSTVGEGGKSMEGTDEEGCKIFPLRLPSQWDPSSDEEEWESDDDIPIMKKCRLSTPKQPIAKKRRGGEVSMDYQY